MFPQDKEGLLAVILKSLKFKCVTLFRLTLIYDMYEVIGENEGHALTSETEFLLEMA